MLAGLFLMAGLSSLALPGMSTVRQRVPGAGRHLPAHPVYAIIATVGIVLAALYVLLAGTSARLHGPGRAEAGRPAGFTRPRPAARCWAIAPLIALILVLGVYPKPVLDIINPAVVAHHARRRADRPGADRPGRRAERRRPVTPLLARRRTPITAPSIDYGALLPILIVLGAACLGVLVEAFVPAASPVARPGRAVALVGLVAALVALHRGAPAPAGSPRCRRGRHRRAGAVPAGHAAGARAGRDPADRRALGRPWRGGALRRPRPRSGRRRARRTAAGSRCGPACRPRSSR